MSSPYQGYTTDQWLEITRRLVREHPLTVEEIVAVVLSSWNSIFISSLGKRGFKIGTHIFPKPQVMGFLLHELIPLELVARHPGQWRAETQSGDKDIEFIPNDRYSIELKTSSDPKHIYGNRSYAQKVSKAKKTKSGYYLTVNFDKFLITQSIPRIKLIRFGWIDSSDWIGQKAATGQQSRLPSEVENYKLLEIYNKKLKK